MRMPSFVHPVIGFRRELVKISEISLIFADRNRKMNEELSRPGLPAVFAEMLKRRMRGLSGQSRAKRT